MLLARWISKSQDPSATELVSGSSQRPALVLLQKLDNDFLGDLQLWIGFG